MNQALDPDLKRWMVEAAERIADKASINRGQKAQLRNLMQIAQEESEVPVLKNFLEYQAGRQATRKFWGPIHQEVIAALAEIAQRTPDDAERRRRLAIQSFFGYMVRRYVYKTETASGGHGRGGSHGGGQGRPRRSR